jgi:hypothetical protein
MTALQENTESPRNNSFKLVMSVFHRRVNEIVALLGFYAVHIGNYLPTFQDNLFFPSSRIKKANCITLREGTDKLTRNVGN